MQQRGRTHLADAADVLVAGLVVKAEILVQAEPDVVAVETVAEFVQVQQVLLKRARDGRLRGMSVVVKSL